jgi:ribosomal subunit interface protein
MSFPTINIKATNMELSDELRSLLEQKIQALEKFIPNDESDVVCQAELERMTDKQSGRIQRAEVNLRVAGKLYRAEATEEQMEKAIDSVRDEIKRELRKARGKEQSLMKRGGQAIKRMVRFGRSD